MVTEWVLKTHTETINLCTKVNDKRPSTLGNEHDGVNGERDLMSYAKAAKSLASPRPRIFPDKGKCKCDDGPTRGGSGLHGESSTKGDLVGYIEKGRKLTSEYLRSTFGHILAPLVLDLRE